MSGSGQRGKQPPATLEAIFDAILEVVNDVTDGVYIIAHATRGDFNNPMEADCARSGIHYVGLKLEDELRTLRVDAAESKAAWT